MATLKKLYAREESLYQRKDPRKYFVKSQRLLADCKTMHGTFQVSIQDLSSGGAFIQTDQALSVGQEVALTISLPGSDRSLKATGEVVRERLDGYAIIFKVLFSY